MVVMDSFLYSWGGLHWRLELTHICLTISNSFKLYYAVILSVVRIVERSNLAALEFLMSKQPRGSVQMSAGNTVGTRVSNIFVDVNKFQSKFHQMKDKEASKGHSSKVLLAKT